MSETLFDVVFKDKFVRQIDQAKVVLHFSKFFKIPIEKTQIFFDGKPRLLKTSLPMDKASYFRAALKKAGLRVSLVKQIDESLQQQKDALTMDDVGAVLVNKAFVQPKHFDTSQFHLDEVGVEIVQPDKIEKPEFDLSGLHMDEVGVEISEPEINIDNIEMAD